MNFDRSSLNKLFRYCLALCGQHDDAYDLLQDSIEKYLHQSEGTVSNPKAFIQRVARNRFFDLQRRKKIVHFDVLEDIDTHTDPERDLEAIVIDELTLKQIWRELSSPEREVVFLWAAEGLTAVEIAKQLDIPRATVLSRLRRLRLRIEQREIAASRGAVHE